MKEITCPRCKGKKYILGQYVEEKRSSLPNYKHNEHGLCFLCDGKGKTLYDEEGKFVYKYKDGKELRYDMKGQYIEAINITPKFSLDECVDYRTPTEEDLYVLQLASDFIEAEYKRNRLPYDAHDPAFMW